MIPSKAKSDFAIELIELKKSFDGKEFVLKGLDLKIPKGSLTAIIGFSGTGKPDPSGT